VLLTHPTTLITLTTQGNIPATPCLLGIQAHTRIQLTGPPLLEQQHLQILDISKGNHLLQLLVVLRPIHHLMVIHPNLGNYKLYVN
jgi:hypothetical protein